MTNGPTDFADRTDRDGRIYYQHGLPLDKKHVQWSGHPVENIRGEFSYKRPTTIDTWMYQFSPLLVSARAGGQYCLTGKLKLM